MARYFMLDDDMQEAIGDIVCDFDCEIANFANAVEKYNSHLVLYHYFNLRMILSRLENLEDKNPGIRDSPIFQSISSDLVNHLGNAVGDLKITR